MIKLVIDAKQKRIFVSDTEIKEVSRNDDLGLSNVRLWYDIDETEQELKFSSFNLLDIDFEGFVLELVDKNGSSFTTEVPGLS